ncbi:MAG: M67 family metallopeptidase [Merismopedia sp. SIO2A8]|nr:M67 family metallopeptidase [Symploca sp. SIO2B6]NET48365.1 M67 family metallopeptidase [Merismopedia sp. SIO2A8]
MTLLIQANHIQQIRIYAEQAYPEECCGLMLGIIPPHTPENSSENNLEIAPENGPENAPETERTTIELWPGTNAWDDNAQVEMAELRKTEAERSFTTKQRYWIDPKDMLAAQKYGRDKNLQIVGIYHSHPNHPAVPSECDRACAWSAYSYIIVSVPNGQATDIFSWVLDEHHQFQAEVLQIKETI